MAKASAREKLARDKQPKKVRLDHDFSGMKAGSLMFVGTPMMVDGYIRDIPFGETRTINALRNHLARRNKCDATCPVSTAIFVRMAAQAAIEAMNEGAPVSEVTPFWRLISGQDKVAKKLDVDPAWIDDQRALEKDHAA